MSGSVAPPRVLNQPLDLLGGRHATRFLVRMLAAAVLVIAIGTLCERTIARSLLPVIRATTAASTDEFEILYMDVVDADNKVTLRLRADLSNSLHIGNYYIEPLHGRGWLQVDLTLGSAMGYSELLLILLLAWPAAGRREALLRAFIGLPLIVALLLLNVTSTSLAELWSAVYRAIDPAMYVPLLRWSRFLMGGGGWAIAVLLAALTVASAAVRLAPRSIQVGDPSMPMT